MQLYLNYLRAVWLLLCASYLTDALPQPGKQAKVYLHDGDDLQSAIDHASPGDQIFVSGTHKGPIVISKDDVSLFGQDAHIVPGNTQITPNECSGFAGKDTQAGICIAGKGITFGEFKEHRRITNVTTPVQGVHVSGFEVVGFSGPNIAVIGAHDTCVSKNILRDSPTYGCITAGSTNSRITDNTVTSSNLNFIGICMDDTGPVEVSRNDISSYLVGLCLQTNSAKVEENKVEECCWAAYLDPKVESVEFKRNVLSSLNPHCPIGILASGIIIDGGINNKIEENLITGMKLSGDKAAGIVIEDESDSLANGNKIERNKLEDNDIDINDMSQGADNEFDNNHCSTSVPPGPCKVRS